MRLRRHGATALVQAESTRSWAQRPPQGSPPSGTAPTSLLGRLAPCKHRPLGLLCVALDIAAPALFPPCSALTAPLPSSGGPPSSCFRRHWLCFPLLCACADVCSAPPLAACAPLGMLAPSVHIVYFQLVLGWHLR
ncbi:hypothetical protein ABPG77_005067 [Micractinium sp. CCAP 211/92]